MNPRLRNARKATVLIAAVTALAVTVAALSPGSGHEARASSPTCAGHGLGHSDPSSKHFADAFLAARGAARDRWPESYAGAWTTSVGDAYDAAHIAFTENAQQRLDELAEDFPCPERLRAVTHRWSHAYLHGLLERMAADRERIAAGELELAGIPPDGRYDLGTSIPENLVEAWVPELTDEIVQAFGHHYGEAVRVNEGLLEADPQLVGKRPVEIVRVVRNPRRGIARVAVRAPGPGKVRLRGNRRVRTFERTVRRAGRVWLRVRPRGAARRQLMRASRSNRRSVRVGLRIVHRAESGRRSRTARPLRLVRRG